MPPENAEIGLSAASVRSNCSSSAGRRSCVPRLGDALEPGEEHEVLGGGEVLVDRGVLPGHAEQLADDVRLTAYVVAEHLARAAVDRQQGGEHLEHRGLAGAVGSEDAEDLAAADLEVDVVDGALVAEGLDQALGPDCGCGLVHVPQCGRSRFQGGFTAFSLAASPGSTDRVGSRPCLSLTRMSDVAPRRARASRWEPLTVGIDIGGTKVLGAVVDPRGQVLALDRRPTEGHDVRKVEDTIVDLVDDVRPGVRRRRGGHRSGRASSTRPARS